MKKTITLIAAALLFAVYLLLPTISYAQPGTLDNAFGIGGKVTTSFGNSIDNAKSIVIQTDGKIVVAGTGSGGFDVVRYNTDGSTDNTFDIDGKVSANIGASNDGSFNDVGNSVAIQADGKIVIAGYHNIDYGNNTFAVIRFNSDGSLDNTFDLDGKVTASVGGLNSVAYSCAIQADGKILVAGYDYNGNDDDFALVRYNTDGSLDNTFDSDGKVTTSVGGANSNINPVAIKIQADGKIVVAGGSTLLRYNNDGSLDNSFDSDGKVTNEFGTASGILQSIAIQTDGKIVAVGANDGHFALVRYNSNGSLDNSFGTNGKINTVVGYASEGSSVAMQTDEKIVVAGYRTVGTTGLDFALIRYNSNGNLDNTFGSGGIAVTSFGPYHDQAYSLAIQADEKIVVAGISNESGSNNDFAVARYNYYPVGINEIGEKNTKIKIYPNPASGIINIEWNGNIYASLQIFNLLGEVVLQQQMEKTLTLSRFPKGIYFLKVNEETNSYTTKIIVQ